MFGFSRKRKAKTVLDQFIFGVYGNPPPPKRADVEQAISLACDKLLVGHIDREEIRKHALDLAATPVPYSTHDLAISVALNFFMQPSYISRLGTAQLLARVQAFLWFKEGFVVGALMQTFENTLYKPVAPGSAPAEPQPGVDASTNMDQFHKHVDALLERWGATPHPWDKSTVVVSERTAKRPIPATEDQRHQFIRELILHRIGAEFIGQCIDDVPLELILASLDSAIFIIIEQYYMFRERGLGEHDAVRALNESQSTTLALVEQELPMLSYPATLFQYARHFIDTQFSHSEPISNDVICTEIEAVKRFYGR
jgi:hypothetical protein